MIMVAEVLVPEASPPHELKFQPEEGTAIMVT
jgi:hypothetical protein